MRQVIIPRHKNRAALALAIAAVCLMVVALLQIAALIAKAQPPDNCLGEPVNDSRATDGDDYLTGSDEQDVVALSIGADQYFAAGGPDILCGNEDPDILAGEGGNDTLNGGAGDDFLIGMGGADSVAGGGGNDTISGGGGDDVVRSLTADDLRDDLYDGQGSDVIIGNSEDIWHQCQDATPDDHDGFAGNTIPDPDC